MRDGFDPGALVSNVLHGATRDEEAYTDLARTFGRIGTEARSDFAFFAPEAPEEEDDPEDEAGWEDEEAEQPAPGP